MTRRNVVVVLAVGLLLLGAVASAVLKVEATSLTVTVNTINDVADLVPGDGVCDNSANAGEQCSLRAAIEELNAQGPDTTLHEIHFNIAGNGPHTLMPASPLPNITVPVRIDGETQSGASCPTDSAPAELKIVLDGSNAGSSATGLTLYTGSDGSIIRGLVIGNFSFAGINFSSNDSAVRCSHIGLAADGFSSLGNDLTGIIVNGDGNIIGGQAFVQQRNVISDNGLAAMYINPGAEENFVANNFIGTNAEGMSGVGNSNGIYIGGENNLIGGTTALTRNVIGDGSGYGIRINGGVGNFILGNYIGVARDGTTPLGNGNAGIQILGESIANVIGGVAAGAGNLIAHNGFNGISVDDNVGGIPTQNRIRGNAIYSNSSLAIDLGSDGVDVNDVDDGDGGENERQNYPVLLGAISSLVVSGTLNSVPNTEYTIDFYRSSECDSSGYGEGQQWVGELITSTNSSGDVAFLLSVDGPLSPGDVVTATATDVNGNTSEFSDCLTVTGLVTPTPTVTATATAGPSSTPTATNTAGPSPTATSTATVGPSPTATATATAGPSPTATATGAAGPSPTATLPAAYYWVYVPFVQR